MMAIIGVPPSLLGYEQCHQVQLFLMRILGSARAPCSNDHDVASLGIHNRLADCRR